MQSSRVSGLYASFESVKACNGSKLLPCRLDLPMDVICAVCHQVGLLSFDLCLISSVVLSRLSTRFPALSVLQLETYAIGKPQIGSISAYANLSTMFSQSNRHDPFEKNIEEDW